MVGEDDVISPPAEAREIAAAIPHARLVVIPAAGHLAPYENPSAANEAILRFLKDWACRASPQSEANSVTSCDRLAGRDCPPLADLAWNVPCAQPRKKA